MNRRGAEAQRFGVCCGSDSQTDQVANVESGARDRLPKRTATPSTATASVQPEQPTWSLRLCASAVLLLLIGCTTTVTPDAVRDHQASYDGNAQNSGLIAELPDHSCVITPHARDRYNALIEKFGARFTPPLVRDAGITATSTNTFVIDAEHFTKFAGMNRWAKEGAK